MAAAEPEQQGCLLKAMVVGGMRSLRQTSRPTGEDMKEEYIDNEVIEEGRSSHCGRPSSINAGTSGDLHSVLCRSHMPCRACRLLKVVWIVWIHMLLRLGRVVVWIVWIHMLVKLVRPFVAVWIVWIHMTGRWTRCIVGFIICTSTGFGRGLRHLVCINIDRVVWIVWIYISLVICFDVCRPVIWFQFLIGMRR